MRAGTGVPQVIGNVLIPFIFLRLRMYGNWQVNKIELQQGTHPANFYLLEHAILVILAYKCQG